MNADAVFRYGHLTLLEAVDALTATDWDTPGACGVWSAKDVLAHLASYELATADVFTGLLGDGATPCLDLLLSQGPAFNAAQVARRAGQTLGQTLEEYRTAHERATTLLTRIPAAQRRQAGLLPWYGAEYDLEDLIIYMSYGHKREHSAQIADVRDRLSEAGRADPAPRTDGGAGG